MAEYMADSSATSRPALSSHTPESPASGAAAQQGGTTLCQRHLALGLKVVAVVLVATIIFTLVGVQSREGAPCNSTSVDAANATVDEVEGVSSYLGIGIACVANAFNGGGMSLQKIGHNRVAAAAGGTPDIDSTEHFKQPMWWLGLGLIVLGEGGNAFAYGLAPASTVAPFGGVGVFTNYLIAVCYLGEAFNLQSVVGIAFIALGVVLTTLAVPESSVAYTAHELLSEQAYLSHRAFWYIIALMVVVMFIAVKLEKDYAERYIAVWAVYASIVSSWTVIACRGLFSMISQISSDCSEQCHHHEMHWPCQSTLGHWLFWVPLHYCVFTLFCIVGGAMVYDEFAHLTSAGWVMFSCGGLACLGGVVVLTSRHRLVCTTAPLACHWEDTSDGYREKSIDEKVDSLRVQRQSSRDVYSPGGALGQLNLAVIAEAHSRRSRRSKIEDAHYPGSARAARVLEVLEPAALPFESHLTMTDDVRLLSRQRSGKTKSAKSPPAPDKKPSSRAPIEPAARPGAQAADCSI